MIRAFLADIAHMLATYHVSRSEFWADVEAWLTTSYRWRDVRRWRHGGPAT